MSRTAKSPKVKLVITKEIIDAAIPRDSQHCMIADALKAARPDARCVSVDLATIRFTDPEKGCRYTYLTPRIAQVCLVNFDRAIKPEPFDFILRSGQVTRSGNTRTPRKMTEKERAQRSLAGKHLNLKKSRILVRDRTTGVVAERVGGKTPPLQKGKDDVPFTRRRAFGLRALEY